MDMTAAAAGNASTTIGITFIRTIYRSTALIIFRLHYILTPLVRNITKDIVHTSLHYDVGYASSLECRITTNMFKTILLPTISNLMFYGLL
jgi:hypothetical protein